VLYQFVKYNIVGIINTLVGFTIILILMFLGFSPLFSNAVGYGVGAIFSYLLNSKYTFNSMLNKQNQIIKFFVVLLLAYGINYVVLQWLLTLLNPYMAQGLAAICYTLSSFIMMKWFIFKEAIES